MTIEVAAASSQPAPARFQGPERDFAVIVKSRVNQHFADRRVSPHADVRMWAKVSLFLTMVIGSNLALYFGNLSLGAAYGAWIVMGLGLALSGVNIAHDAQHGAFSARPVVNRAFGMVFDLIGASGFNWRLKHNRVHHTYTNVEGQDADLRNGGVFMRLSPNEAPSSRLHRVQHLYALPLYGLTVLHWVLFEDYRQLFAHRIGLQEKTATSWSTFAGFTASKLFFYSMFIILPMIVLPFTWWQTLLGFVLMAYVGGMLLGVIFMVGHIEEKSHFSVADHASQINRSWHAHQLVSATNFGHNHFWPTFLSGGLNYQIEHHLFPQVCHVHYPEISQIVKQTALEHGLPYNEHPTWTAALASHLRFLKRLGENAPATVPL